MTALARTFPGLAPKFDAELNGLDPWDGVRLALAAQTWTSEQQQIAAFLLTVWDTTQELTAPFNLVEAVAEWEPGDREALVAWALKPFSF